MKAVRYHQYGGPDILTYEEVPLPEVRSDEVLIKVSNQTLRTGILNSAPGQEESVLHDGTIDGLTWALDLGALSGR